MRTSVLMLAAVALSVAGLNVAWAGAFVAGPLVQVSGTSPFVGCTADDVAGQPGINFLHSEVEPWIDVNPSNANNIVGVFQQDRWSDGGARGLVARASTNGGASWIEVVIPGITLCSSGVYERATDPWVSFAPNGDAYHISLSFNSFNPPLTVSDFDHALLVSKSTTGGLSWSAPVIIRRDTLPTVFNDKQSITADPTNANLVYAVWDRLVFPPGERANIIASFRAAAFRGPVWFARTTNGGATWEPARLIFDPGTLAQTIGNQIVVLPDGTLVNVFDLFYVVRNAHKLRGLNVALIRSTDKGITWSERAIIVDELGTIGVQDPESGDPVRTGDIAPEVAVDSTTGNLYLVWQDARLNNSAADGIAFSMSTDGGLTWSPRIKLNKTPTNIPLGNQQAFTPSIHVSSDGTIAVTYYDLRNNTSAADLRTDYWIVHCHPTTSAACTNPGNWGQELRLTNTSFDMRQAPFARGFFTGDYEGLTSAGTQFLTFFSMPHGTAPVDPSSTFFRRAGP
jgi:hypothetical protein